MTSGTQPQPQEGEHTKDTTTNGTQNEPSQENQKTPDSTTQPNSSGTQDSPSNPRLQSLLTKKATLESTLADLQAQKSTLVSQAKLPSGLAMPASWSEEEKAKSALATANGTMKEHIALLHKYNEVKDIAQGLMGLIAETRGVRVKVVMEEFGMGEGD